MSAHIQELKEVPVVEEDSKESAHIQELKEVPVVEEDSKDKVRTEFRGKSRKNRRYNNSS